MSGRGFRLLLAIPLLQLALTVHAQSRNLPAGKESDSIHLHSVIAQQQILFPGPIGMRPWPRSAPPGPELLPQLARAAGTIFSGTVVSVARTPTTRTHTVGVVTITFHIERSIRGAIPGENVSISEWIGLWSSGQRYRVGDRLLVFLYPPSQLGLTSTVGGTLGRFAVDGANNILLEGQHFPASYADPVLAGKSHVTFDEFARAVLRAQGQE